MKVYVAGHTGMVGSALLRKLRECGYDNVITRTRSELDLTNQLAVREFFESEKPEVVYLAAAKVGGILANANYPADFLFENLMIETNIISSAFNAGTRKLLFLGSSCIYPRLAEQPMREDALLAGKLEPTNEAYAIAKIAGIKLCEGYNNQYGNGSFLEAPVDYRSVMPTNLYGLGDNYHAENSHVVPALIKRFDEAKRLSSPYVTIWGTGTPRREFLFVDDLADACIHVMTIDRSTYMANTEPNCSHVNVGYGSDISILELAGLVCQIVEYQGDIICDSSKPDGAPQKLMDSSVLNSLGWFPRVSLEQGLELTYRDYLTNPNHRKV